MTTPSPSTALPRVSRSPATRFPRPRSISRRVSWEDSSKSTQMRATAGGVYAASQKSSSSPSDTTGSEQTSDVPIKTPLLLTWVFTTLIWSIFTPPNNTFAARMVLFQPLWLIRIFTHDETWTRDLALFEIVHAVYSYFSGAWRFFRRDDFWWLDFTDHTMQMYLQVFSLLGVCATFAGGINFRGLLLRPDRNDEAMPIYEQRIEEQIMPPLLLPSRTTHSRMFPKKHSFSYSYLYVGIPVGFQGCLRRILSVDNKRRGWFVVNSADYLQRTDGQTLLAAKLRRYMRSMCVSEEDYAFAYLVTAPRFMGYSFNPVSFWYLYDSSTHLKYMVLEVNNTFDERRMYLLRPDRKEESPNGIDDGAGPTKSAQVVFTEEWKKDFHVSPFNSRKGSYSLRAIDPLAAYEKTGQVQIDNTIVLRSSKYHAKIVARVFTEGPSQDPKTTTSLQLIHFILSWWWVGFATFPRIVYEASRLFFRRHLHVWYRPEVTTTSISRVYTSEERLLESFFRAFLTQAVQDSRESLRVIYEPPHTTEPEIVLYSSRFTYEEDQTHTLTLNIVSPAFYSRFVHYAHATEALDREGLINDEKNQTIHVQNANRLPLLIQSMKSLAPPSVDAPPPLGPLARLRWSLMTRLRCPPALGSYPVARPGSSATDIRHFGASEFDRFVQTACEDRETYRHIVSKLFVAERIGLGIPVLVDVMDVLVCCVLFLASFLQSDLGTVYYDVLRHTEIGKKDMVGFVGSWGLANAVHLWSFVKGLT